MVLSCNVTCEGYINTLLSVCVKQKLYKVLSEVKGEVETVIKTGRQIVQKQQTEQPKELDDRVTALKLLYNQLGAQVRHTQVDRAAGCCDGLAVSILNVCL